jgi:hypothetical protein
MEDRMTRGQAPEQGRYEVRPHMASGVLAVFWVPTPGSAGQVLFSVGSTATLAAVGRAIANHLAGTAGEYERGREAALLELATMDAAERADLLSRVRHPSSAPVLKLAPEAAP